MSALICCQWTSAVHGHTCSGAKPCVERSQSLPVLFDERGSWPGGD